MMNLARFGAAALAFSVFAAASGSARAATVPRTLGPIVAAPAFAAAEPDAGMQAAYCRSTGGVVEHRIPEFGTNDPKPLVLAGSADFCQYTSKKDMSRIHVRLKTLYAQLPSLAALAYYAKVKFNEATCPGGANPASCYCTQLGGSDQFGGPTLGGGSWVGKGVDVDLEACIFPDLSSIDSFGLFYHSANDIRGIDLSKVLRYHKK